MTIERGWGWGVALAFLAGGGCVTVDPSADLDRARTLSQQAAASPNAVVARESTATGPAESEAQLEGGLSMDEAVRIALENSPELRAIFHEVGVAHAEWVEAGLIDNPTFSLSLLFPSGGGRSESDFGLAQAITSFWLPTQDATRAELDRAVLDAAAQAATLARETRNAFATATTNDALVEAAQQAVDLARLNSELVQRKADSGRATIADVALVDYELTSTEVEIERARFEAREARRDLAALLATPRQLDATTLLPSSAADPGPTGLQVEELVSLARSQRPDLLALEAAIEAARVEVEIERRGRFPEIALGPSMENDDGGINFYGGDVELTLSIWGNDRAQTAAAIARLQRLEAERDALLIEVETDVASALDRWLTSTAIERIYTDRVLPQSKRQLELEESAYQGGVADLLAVIEAQKDLIAAQRDGVLTSGETQRARAALVEAIGGAIPSTAATP